MRTVSSTAENRSAGATPKTATLNSRDVQFGVLNTSASSGSHTLDMDHSKDNITDYSGNKYDPNTEMQDSVHMHTGTSSFRSSRENADRNRIMANGTYENEKINYGDRREEEDTVNMDHPLKGASENNSNHFNYNYYQLSYDAMGAHDVSANQNADDILYEDDNVSYDSYRLTSSSRDDSLERELDRYDIPNTVLHIDEEKLLRELEAEKRVVLQGAQDHKIGGASNYNTQGGDNKDVFLEVASELEDSIMKQNQENAEVKPYVVAYQRTIIEDNLMKSSVENLELEVVGVLDSYCRSASQEDDGALDGEDSSQQPIGKEQVSDNKDTVSDNTNNVMKNEINNTVHSDTENVEKVKSVCVKAEKPDVDDKVQNNLNYEHYISGESKIESSKMVDLDPTTNKSRDDSSLIDDIPYVLHKRHVSSERKTPATLPKPRSRSKTPSPSRQMSVPLTRKQHRAQLEKIKTSLTSPLSPPMSPPVGNKPRSASPQTRRTFDFVTYSKLPPCDSYSSKDDSLSPSKDNEFILKTVKSHSKDKNEEYNEVNNSVVSEISIHSKVVDNKDSQKYKEQFSSDDRSQGYSEVHSTTASKKLGHTAKEDEEIQCHRILQIQKLDTFSISSESDVEFGNDDDQNVLLEVEQDVNIILSECGEDELEEENSLTSSMII